MATYKEVFSKLDRAALIPFFVIGDPDYDTSIQLVKTAIDAGADVLELGIAFSDPIADGPTIQAADIRALKSGMTVARAFEFIKELADYRDIPIGLLVYYNLVYQYGAEKFFADFKAAGGSSVLVADLSIDDCDEVTGPAESAGMETVFMVTPNTSDDRTKLVASRTTGFIYTVSILGVTGARARLSDMVKPLIGRLKSMTNVPVCVGFGISKPEHAQAVAKAGADGVIIGSRIVGMIEANLGNRERMVADIAGFLTEVRSTLATS